MASEKKILKELEQLEALAETMKDKCSRIRATLGVVAPTPYNSTIAKVLANRNKTLLKKRA